jgi:putative ABC transport system permease protein
MFRNHIKIALRNLLRYRGYSFINIAGLAIGIAASMLIILHVIDELSYDRFHPNADRIYRVVQEQRFEGVTQQVAVIGPPVLPAIVKDYPEVELGVRTVRRAWMTSRGDQKFTGQRIMFADSGFFDLFGFGLIRGDARTAIQAKNTIVLTEEFATKAFGPDDPIGKTVRVNNNDDYTVTGIMWDPPANSHMRFNAVASFSSMYKDDPTKMWGSNWIWGYLRLRPGASPSEFNAKLPALIEKYRGKETLKNISYYLQPLTAIHLYSNMVAEMYANSDILYVYIFSAIGAFILLIACINYMNLATARSSRRMKEVGMRKVLGAYRTQIMRQFLTESFLITVIALCIGLLLVEIILPQFNAFTGKHLSLNYLSNFVMLAGIALLSLLVGVAAGGYPAFFLSQFQPVTILKGVLKSGKSGVLFRRVLVVAQFALSIILIVGTISVFQQLDYVKSKHLGFDKEHLVNIHINDRSLSGKLPLVKSEFMRVPGVVNVTSVSQFLGGNASQTGMRLDGMPEGDRWLMSYFSVDAEYMKTTNIKLAAGRFFSSDIASDTLQAFVINETAAKKMGFTPEEALGKQFYLGSQKGTIIGIVRDFHFASLHNEIEPLVLTFSPDELSDVIVRIRPERFQETLAGLETTFNKLSPGWPFDFAFADEAIEALYKTDLKIGTAVGIFASVAIFVACLGLLGLAAFTSEQRRKEIGVRKVLGASVTGVVGLLSREFVKLVLIANIIAWPVAYYATSRWLQNFAYRAEISVITYLLAALLALAIAIVTISYQATRAALSNPVEALRYE